MVSWLVLLVWVFYYQYLKWLCMHKLIKITQIWTLQILFLFLKEIKNKIQKQRSSWIKCNLWLLQTHAGHVWWFVYFISSKCFQQNIFEICFWIKHKKCCTGNMISTTLKLLSLTTIIFILNTIFYLPQSSRRNKTKNVNDFKVNHSEKTKDTPKFPENIITVKDKRDGLKYILYWNEAYDSKGISI